MTQQIHLYVCKASIVGPALPRSFQDRLTKNYYVHLDNRTGFWTRLPWDLEASFGASAGYPDGLPDLTNGYCILECERFNSPLYGDVNHPQDVSTDINIYVPDGLNATSPPPPGPPVVAFDGLKADTSSDAPSSAAAGGRRLLQLGGGWLNFGAGFGLFGGRRPTPVPVPVPAPQAYEPEPGSATTDPEPAAGLSPNPFFPGPLVPPLPAGFVRPPPPPPRINPDAPVTFVPLPQVTFGPGPALRPVPPPPPPPPSTAMMMPGGPQVMATDFRPNQTAQGPEALRVQGTSMVGLPAAAYLAKTYAPPSLAEANRNLTAIPSPVRRTLRLSDSSQPKKHKSHHVASLNSFFELRGKRRIIDANTLYTNLQSIH